MSLYIFVKNASNCTSKIGERPVSKLYVKTITLKVGNFLKKINWILFIK